VSLYEIDHPRTEHHAYPSPIPCPDCRKKLTVTEYGTTRELSCECGYAFDENTTDAQGNRRGR
jgi:rubredoxin